MANVLVGTLYIFMCTDRKIFKTFFSQTKIVVPPASSTFSSWKVRSQRSRQRQAKQSPDRSFIFIAYTSHKWWLCHWLLRCHQSLPPRSQHSYLPNHPQCQKSSINRLDSMLVNWNRLFSLNMLRKQVFLQVKKNIQEKQGTGVRWGDAWAS